MEHSKTTQRGGTRKFIDQGRHRHGARHGVDSASLLSQAEEALAQVEE